VVPAEGAPLSGGGLRLVLFGMPGVFTGAVLRAMLGAGVRPTAVVVAGLRAEPAGTLPVEVAGGPPETLALIRQSGALLVRWTDAATVAGILERLAPDLALVACFPRRLPGAVAGAARLGTLNLHPSLLPRYRGPAPVFWQLRAGERDTGVTLHLLSERLDAGDVVAQAPVELPEGASGPTIDQVLGEAGAELLLRVLAAPPGGRLQGRVQAESEATCQPRPGLADFEVPTAWSARRAFNFMRGTAHWGYPFALTGPDVRLRARDATGYWPDRVLGRSVSLEDGRARVQLVRGVVEVALA
jgi:methionyl-tRNA formyltransferase